ncbi:ATP-grasp domain-containing protein [Histidinibacterium aquaticum]|uniref:ATP-grasp domain-containing protein n=1 Tax=Histidinibacterium aquaticum TaxID=2613962 RepID=A0A5J5GC38_9RHOB|nr:ATP-grasp domain-containing protein [Histidinibacterium aquaticum]KAA9005726.1 ATP-grasp domain-containing protein [Histidinibacterium aquaticum]
MTKIAVIGYNDFTSDYLADTVGKREHVDFVPGLYREETIIEESGFPFEDRLDLAERRVRESGATGVMTYWDFPSSVIAPFLAKRMGFPYASVEAVMKCEHKYWFRQEQAKVLDTPGFCSFDPFADDPLKQITLDYPFWVKPVVGHSSMLGFEITSAEDFEAALEEIRRDIGELTQPFDYPLKHTDLPQELVEGGPTLCMAEEMISQGDQYTIEGYVHENETVVYGTVASIREENGHTFNRYQYPASVDDEVSRRMNEMAAKIIRQIGYDNCPFNMEFFHDPETDTLNVLEMNSRLSQSHSHLFDKVDGQPHQTIAVELALGETPQWRRRGGKFDIAAKHFVRVQEDGVVRRIPHKEDCQRLHEEMPDIVVDSNVSEGDRLSELPEQESYSYELADLFIGAKDETELLKKYERAKEVLPYEID